MKRTFLILALFLMNSLAYANEALQGEWTQTCQLGYSKTQIFQDDSSATTEFFYQDKNCKHESFRFQTNGSVKFSAENTTWIHFTYESVQLTLFSLDAIEDFNNRQVCGFSDWQQGVTKQITGLTCALFTVNQNSKIPHSGDSKFGIYKIEDDKLFYGKMTKEKDGSSIEKRPTEFSLDFLIKSL